MCAELLSSLLFACSRVYSAVDMYSFEMRQQFLIQMFITEIVQVRKCWELENNHQLYLARYNEHFDCFPKNSLIEAFDITNP